MSLIFLTQFILCVIPCAGELITYVTDRLGRDRRYSIDPSKSNSEIAYQPEESFETGIKRPTHHTLADLHNILRAGLRSILSTKSEIDVIAEESSGIDAIKNALSINA